MHQYYRLMLLMSCAMALVAARPAHTLADDCLGCTEQGGYWVVSTYHMTQQLGCCPDNFNFSCYYKPICGKLCPSSIGELQASLNPNLPTCIFVHGSFVDIDLALNDARFTYSWLKKGRPNCPFNMIFFVWPSDEVEAFLPNSTVIRNGLRSDHNGMYLAHFLDLLPPSSPLCLMGHSHGCRLISACQHYRAGGEIQHCLRPGGCATPRTVRAVFAAAAMNHEWLNPGEKFGLALTQTTCLMTLVNRKDLALAIYPLVGPSYGRALSKTGTTLIDRRRLGPYLDKIKQVDLTFDVGFRHSWSIYYSSLPLSRLVADFMHQGPQPQFPAYQLTQDNEPAIEPANLMSNHRGQFPPLTMPPAPLMNSDLIPLLPTSSEAESSLQVIQ